MPRRLSCLLSCRAAARKDVAFGPPVPAFATETPRRGAPPGMGTRLIPLGSMAPCLIMMPSYVAHDKSASTHLALLTEEKERKNLPRATLLILWRRIERTARSSLIRRLASV